MKLAAFFIATDYVTSPNSPVGQAEFGAGCGLIVFVIGSWGGYPEGTGFAIPITPRKVVKAVPD